MPSQMQDFEICGSFNNNQYLDVDAEITINMFEYIDPQGKKPKSLFPTSGIIDSYIEFAATKGFRAQFVFQGPKDSAPFMYCVIGNNVFRVANDGTVLTLTSALQLSTTEGYIGIDANTFQIIIVDGIRGYIIDTETGSPTFGVITDPGFPSVNAGTGAPIDVCYLDGFFVVAAGNTNNFYLSEFNNGYIWSLTDVIFGITQGSNTLQITGNFSAFRLNVPVTLYAVGNGATLPNNFSINTTYYIVNIQSTSVQISATINGTPILAGGGGSGTYHITNNGILQVGSITTHPGNIVACKTLHRRLFLFSQNYTEVWENQGIGSSLPFRRNNSLLMEYGCAAIASVVVGFDIMFFLSQDKDGLGAVMMVQGSQSIPVSTNPIDNLFAQYAAIFTTPPGQGVADAKGILIKENGLIFYRLNFTKANSTFVYNHTMSDQQNKRWHQEETLNGNRHPAQTHAYFNGINYYGDYLYQTLYIVSSKLVSNNGESIKRVRITRNFTPATYQRIRVDRLQVDLLQGQVEYIPDAFGTFLLAENGQQIKTESDKYLFINEVGNNIYLFTEDDQDIETEDYIPILIENGMSFIPEINTTSPYVYLSISKDGGYTFGNPLAAPMGSFGQRTFRTVWRKLGTIPRGQGFVAKFEFYNQVPFLVLGAAWSYEVLPQ